MIEKFCTPLSDRVLNFLHFEINLYRLELQGRISWWKIENPIELKNPTETPAAGVSCTNNKGSVLFGQFSFCTFV